MKTKIVFQEPPNAETSLALNELRNRLWESDIPVEPDTGTAAKGTKNQGLTLALTIAGLSINAVGIFVSAIALWGSKRNYSISFKIGEVTFTAHNLSPSEVLSITRVIKDKAVASDIKVLVSKK